MRVLAGKRVTLGVTGSIAAYKAVGLASALHQAGAIVDVAMTPDALRFIQPLSFQAITHRPVFADLWAPGMETDIAHVTLGQQSDVIVVAPATANMLAKVAHGICDDLVSLMINAAACPVVFAPAMNNRMWDHPVARENVAKLQGLGYRFIGPEPGWLACRNVGVGRMSEPAKIVEDVLAMLAEPAARNASQS